MKFWLSVLLALLLCGVRHWLKIIRLTRNPSRPL